VKAFSLRFYSNGGSVETSAPVEIGPSSSSVEEKVQISRYLYFCDGVTKHTFSVISVTFADGSEWDRPHR